MDITGEIPAFTRSLRARGRSEETVKTYLKAVNQLAVYLGTREATKTELEEFLVDARTKGMSPVTLAQRFRSLQQFFKWAAAELDEENPILGLAPPKHEVKPPTVMTAANLEAVFAASGGTSFEDRRDLAILSLFADTGIRRSEMAGIRLADIDLDAQAIVVTGKTGTRAVPYGATTATRLDRYLRARRKHDQADEPWLWLGRKGRFTVFGVEGVVVARGKRAGLDLNPHLFRHTFAHLWLDGGGNEGDLQRLAGWRSNQMLARYGASAASARARRAYLAGRSPVDTVTKNRV